MTITSPPGTPIGYIEQRWDIIKPKFDILDENKQCVLKIEGPICACNMCGDVDFEVCIIAGIAQRQIK